MKKKGTGHTHAGVHLNFKTNFSQAEFCAILDWEIRSRKKCMVDCVSAMPDILGSHEVLTEPDVGTLCDHE